MLYIVLTLGMPLKVSGHLVTRLAGFDLHDVKGMIDRALAARNRGTSVIDLKSDADEDGKTGCAPRGSCYPRDGECSRKATP